MEAVVGGSVVRWRGGGGDWDAAVADVILDICQAGSGPG